MVVRLGEILRVRPTYFFRPPFEHGTGAVFFRSLASARKRDLGRQQARLRWVQELAIVIQHYVDLPPVNIPELPKDSSYRSLRDEDIEHIAGELRKRWQLGDRPIADVVRVLERAGIVVTSDEMGTTSLDGLCNWSDFDGRPYVLLAQDKMSFFRRQMDAAHELGHAVLHRGLTENDLRSDFDLIEQQAFRLASAFLMPASAFALAVGTYPTLQSLLMLKDRWHVSVKAMIHRCRDLSLIDPSDALQLYKYYSAKRWTRGEPLDNSVPVPSPQMLGEALRMIVSSGTRTKEDLLANEFTVPARDVEDLLGLGEGWFNQRPAEIIQLRSVTRHSTAGDQHETGAVEAITRLRQAIGDFDRDE
jgi:Zn-dependent peptidase ImmA (M78 family)